MHTPPVSKGIWSLAVRLLVGWGPVQEWIGVEFTGSGEDGMEVGVVVVVVVSHWNLIECVWKSEE